MSKIPSSVAITPLEPSQADAVNQHLKRHIFESGQHGVHWLPYDPASLTEPPAVKVPSLSLSYDLVGWERWTVVSQADTAVGHLSLKGARFDRGVHRCELGMGLEAPYRGVGIGTQLILLAIEQARSIPSVDWLDLHVLSVNTPGINLYQRHGFSEHSRIQDFCRIEGRPADDIFMTLWVGST